MGQATSGSLAATFRDVMARVCAPVSVVTTMVGDRPHGTTVSAFTSLSMAPPMVMLALSQDSSLSQHIEKRGRFGLNVLTDQHSDAALVFAQKGESKFADVDWILEDGMPRLPMALGWVSCELAGAHDGGDHLIVLGRVRRVDFVDGRPLTYYMREFGTHTSLSPNGVRAQRENGARPVGTQRPAMTSARRR